MQGASFTSARLEIGDDQVARERERRIGLNAGVKRCGLRVRRAKGSTPATYSISRCTGCGNPLTQSALEKGRGHPLQAAAPSESYVSRYYYYGSSMHPSEYAGPLDAVGTLGAGRSPGGRLGIRPSRRST